MRVYRSALPFALPGLALCAARVGAQVPGSPSRALGPNRQSRSPLRLTVAQPNDAPTLPQITWTAPGQPAPKGSPYILTWVKPTEQTVPTLTNPPYILLWYPSKQRLIPTPPVTPYVLPWAPQEQQAPQRWSAEPRYPLFTPEDQAQTQVVHPLLTPEIMARSQVFPLDSQISVIEPSTPAIRVQRESTRP